VFRRCHNFQKKQTEERKKERIRKKVHRPTPTGQCKRHFLPPSLAIVVVAGKNVARSGAVNDDDSISYGGSPKKDKHSFLHVRRCRCRRRQSEKRRKEIVVVLFGNDHRHNWQRQKKKMGAIRQKYIVVLFLRARNTVHSHIFLYVILRLKGKLYIF
jgi:hypothetical protein